MRSGFGPWLSQLHIRYDLNSIQFISDESSAELILYLCEYIPCIALTTFFKINNIYNNKYYANSALISRKIALGELIRRSLFD